MPLKLGPQCGETPQIPMTEISGICPANWLVNPIVVKPGPKGCGRPVRSWQMRLDRLIDDFRGG